MKKIFFIFLLILTYGNVLFAQEICDNGIDDDLDGLVDLNDTSDCKCSESLLDVSVPSLIPNESFEKKSSCPVTYSQMGLLESWRQASAATSDYLNTCGYYKIPIFYLDPPSPIPDGSGYVGFFNGESRNDSMYKEYVGACLYDTLFEGVSYRLEFYVALGRGSLNTQLSIFGTDSCNRLPFGGTDIKFGCPTNGLGWVELDNIDVSLDSNSWSKVSFNFVPTTNITTIVLGPSCQGSPSWNYYYLDGLVLNSESRFISTVEIHDSGNYCLNNLLLKAVSDSLPSSYQWYKNGVALVGDTGQILRMKPDSVGEYSVRVTYASGCLLSTSYVVNDTKLLADLEVISGCESLKALGEITVSNTRGGSAPYLYSLDDSLPSSIEVFTSLLPGSHKLIIIDSEFCSDTMWVDVDTILSPEVYLGLDSIFCDSVNHILISQTNIGDISYLWNSGDTTSSLAVNMEGIYWLKVENECGIDRDSVSLNLYTTPITNLGEDKVFCDEMPDVFLQTGKQNNEELYLWSDGSDSNELTVNEPGNYWVVTNNRCGTSFDTIKFSIVPSPMVSLGLDTPLCGLFSLNLDAGIDGMTYLWEPFGETSKEIFAMQQGIYRVTITDSNGCQGSDELEITDDCKSLFFIPNSFTPNGDGLNDKFSPVFQNIYDYEMSIYNRWGELLFRTSDMNNHWDGIYQGELVQQGCYFYIVSYKYYEDGKLFNTSGTITLIK